MGGHLLNEDTTVNPDSIITNTNSDVISSSVPLTQTLSSTSVLSIPAKPEPFSVLKPRDLFIKDPETEMQVIELDTNVKSKYINQDVNSQNAAPKEEFEALGEQKHRAVVTLMNLQLAGFSEKDIMELTGLVNTWNNPGRA
jgi:hypothetical protein